MKRLRNALDVTANGHVLMKGGYIQLPTPIEMTEEWLDAPSNLYKMETNRARLIIALKENSALELKFEEFINKTVYSVPDETVYKTYLEITREDKLMDAEENMNYEEVQRYLLESDAYIDETSESYSKISEQLITHIWDYHALKDIVKQERLVKAYVELYTEATWKALLFINAHTSNMNLEVCFKER